MLLSNPGQVKRSHISATTLRERLPVVVNFSPGPTNAEWSKIKAFRATADCPISSGAKSAAKRMAPTGGNGGRRRASKLFWSSIIHAGTIPPSQFLTADFCRKPDATMVLSSRIYGCRAGWNGAESHSFNFDQRRRPDTFFTAMATAFFCPTRTTSRLPRVTPV